MDTQQVADRLEAEMPWADERERKAIAAENHPPEDVIVERAQEAVAAAA